MADSTQTIQQLSINTIRTLSMDAVAGGQQRPSGHAHGPGPGRPTCSSTRCCASTPRGPAGPTATASSSPAAMPRCCCTRCCTWARCKQADERGRPLDELAVPLDDIRRFRQLGSRCPGHPEHGHTSGVETTTGPLGQGIGNSVGMAIASRWLAARYNRPGLRPVRLQRLRPVQRRRLDGRRRRRGGLAGRPPQALQPLLDLRRQHDHHRGPHHAGLQRGRGRAVRRLRLERGQGGRRQRPGGPARRARRPSSRPATGPRW